jgi:protein SCO1/2
MKAILCALALVAAPALAWSAPAAELPPSSLYQLPMALTDHNGKQIDLAVFRGSPVIISLFYASCPAACPMLISQIKQYEKRLAPQAREKVRVLLVSFDPENDTPAELTKISNEHRLDLKRWRLTSGSDSQVRELAALLGFKYRKLPEGGYNHSSLITLLDQEGVIQARYEGLEEVPEEAIDRLTKLTKKKPRTGRNR